MPRKKGDSRKVKTALSGYSRWAFEKYCEAHGKTEGAGLAAVVESWLRLEDRAFLERFGVSLELYRKARGENLAQFEKKANGALKPRA
jgi:hypothetical protein